MGFLDLSLAQSTVTETAAWTGLSAWKHVMPFKENVMELTNLLHTWGGLEWWGAIVGTTLIIRAGTAPLFFTGIKTGARFMDHQDGLMEIMKRLKRTQESGDKEAMTAAAMERVAYAKKHGLQFYKMFLPIVLQIPIFISLFGAMRQFGYEAHLWDGFLTGGTAWFPYLHVPDPRGVFGGGLPALSAGLAGVSMLLNNNLQGIPQMGLTVPGQRLFFFTMSVGFALLTTTLPATVVSTRRWLREGRGGRSLWQFGRGTLLCGPSTPPASLLLPLPPAHCLQQLYIATTSATMLAQQALLRSRTFTRAIGMPVDWPPSKEKIAAMQKKR